MIEMRLLFPLLLLSLILACGPGDQYVVVEESAITESVYASGRVLAADQYTAVPEVAGILQRLWVLPGDTVFPGDTLALLERDLAGFALEQAQQQLAFAQQNASAQSAQLAEARAALAFAQKAWRNDSDLYERQLRLQAQGAGSELALMQRQTSMENAKGNYLAAQARFLALQEKVNLELSLAQSRLQQQQASSAQFVVTSAVFGLVWQVYPEVGSYLSPQSPIADVGRADSFYVELDVDEFDIGRVRIGQRAILRLDAFPDELFEGSVQRLHPILNPKSRTFRVEVAFDRLPQPMFSQLSVEASLVVQTIDKALVLPRAALLNDRQVILENGDTVAVQTGLKNYQFIQITQGIRAGDRVLRPNL